MPRTHGSAAAANRGRLVAILLLSLAILGVEVVGGLLANSLALLADAGHMLTDVAGSGWTITSGMNVVSAHVTLAEGADPTTALDALSACLSDDFDIEHPTFQLETVDRRPIQERSHA